MSFICESMEYSLYYTCKNLLFAVAFGHLCTQKVPIRYFVLSEKISESWTQLWDESIMNAKADYVWSQTLSATITRLSGE